MTRPAWTDEQLSAFLDGELPAADMDALARDLEADSSLAARAERLRSANAAFVASAVRIDDVPVGAALQAAMDAPSAAKVIPFRKRSVGAFLVEHRAIAASLLCAAATVGFMSTMATGSPSDPFATGADGVILASSPLYRALETARTGEVVLVGADAAATPRLTFASDTGEFCRQFDVVTGDKASAAIACREEKGWRTQIVAYGLARTEGDFQTASAARSPALEAFLDQNMSGAPMNADEEAKLLGAGWRSAAQ